MEKVSFVIPCYRSERTIKDVVNEIIRAFVDGCGYDYEIVLVNDCSPDNVWTVIKSICENNPKVKGICLSRNFGQASAVMAGYSHVTGDYIITCDDDGQSPIDATFSILNHLKENDLDVVYGVCPDAKFNLFRKFGSALNSLMASAMFDRPKNVRIVSFSVARRYVINEVIKYTHSYPYMSGLVHRSTKKIGYFPVIHRARASGKSGYNLKKLFSVWLNGLTAFSIKPLHLSNYIGIISAFLGFFCGIIVFIKKLIIPTTAAGWSSVICIMLFLGGIILLVLGLIGEYVGRIYMCINNSPQFIVRERLNYEKE